MLWPQSRRRKRRPLVTLHFDGLIQQRKTTVEYTAFCDFKINTGVFRSVTTVLPGLRSAFERQALSGTVLVLTNSKIITATVVIVAIIIIITIINR